MRFLLLAPLIYLLPCLAAWLWQDRLLYYPDQRGPSTAARMGLRAWPSPQHFRAYLASERVDSPRTWATALVWHGNAGSALDRTYFIDALGGRGLRVLLVEYPGYGGRPGPRREARFVEDARDAARLALREWGQPLVVVGESMGCAVAAAVAADPQLNVRGALLITPWADLPSLAQTVYWWLPARWLTRDRFDNGAYLADFHRPVVAAVAARDEVIPNAHSERLLDALQGPCLPIVFEGATHNGWPTHPDAQWWDRAVDFLRSGGP